MSKKTFASSLAQAALFASILTLSAQNTPATLTLHPDQHTTAVSPTLYGLMTEEINYSYDGGLYAEMVRNRTFYGDWSGIHNWYLYEGGNAIAKMAHDPSSGPSTALPTSLKIEISQADAQSPAGVAQHRLLGLLPSAPTPLTTARSMPKPTPRHRTAHRQPGQ